MAKHERFFENLLAMASKLPRQGGIARAVVSFIQRAAGMRMSDGAPADAPEVVRGMGWRDFESLICAALREEGYRVDERGGSGPTGEIDLIASRAKKRLLIQCKHWKTQQVGVSVIRDLSGVVVARRADGGVAVTGGAFTKEAHDLAQGCGIRLIDGKWLQEIIAAQAAQRALLSPTASAAPTCPKCGAQMVDRVAQQGKFAGRHFWACGEYPKCTGIASFLEAEEATRGSRSAA